MPKHKRRSARAPSEQQAHPAPSLSTEVDRFLKEPARESPKQRNNSPATAATEHGRFLELVRSLNQELDRPLEQDRQGVRLVNAGRATLKVDSGADTLELEGGDGKTFEPTFAEPDNSSPLPTYVARFLHLLVENTTDDETEMAVDVAAVDPQTQHGLTVVVATGSDKGRRFQQVVSSATFKIGPSASLLVIGIGFSVSPRLMFGELRHERED